MCVHVCACMYACVCVCALVSVDVLRVLVHVLSTYGWSACRRRFFAPGIVTRFFSHESRHAYRLFAIAAPTSYTFFCTFKHSCIAHVDHTPPPHPSNQLLAFGRRSEWWTRRRRFSGERTGGRARGWGMGGRIGRETNSWAFKRRVDHHSKFPSGGSDAASGLLVVY